MVLSFSIGCKTPNILNSELVSESQIPTTPDTFFRLLDQHSDVHTLNDYKSMRSIFITRVDLNCHYLNINKLIENQPKNDSSVSLIIHGGSKNEKWNLKKLSFPVLFDDFYHVVDHYRLFNSGQFVEISSDDGRVINRGQLNLKLNPCMSQSDRIAPSFDDIKEVFAKQCLYCHMQNNELDYFKTTESIKKWSKMSKVTLETFRMPPGGFDTQLQHKLHGFVPREELKKLYDWFYFEAPFKDTDQRKLDHLREQMIAERTKKLNQLGQAIEFYETKPYSVPPFGEDHGLYNYLGGPIKENLLLVAAQFNHNPKVLHHSVIYSTPQNPGLNSSRLPIEMFLTQKVSPQHYYAEVEGKKTPGIVYDTSILFGFSNNYEDNFEILRNNSAVFVPKGSFLTLNNHFQSIGISEINQSRIKLFKFNGKNPDLVKRKILQVDNFVIGPHESGYVIKSIYPIKKRIKLFSIRAHLHMRGRSVKVYLKDNQSNELIFSIPFYLYKHNKSVSFEEPIILNKDSVLYFETVYDNTVKNPGNPDPNQNVKTGLSILNNEMNLMVLTYSDLD